MSKSTAARTLTLSNALPLVEGGAKKMPGTYFAGVTALGGAMFVGSISGTTLTRHLGHLRHHPRRADDHRPRSGPRHDHHGLHPHDDAVHHVLHRHGHGCGPALFGRLAACRDGVPNSDRAGDHRACRPKFLELRVLDPRGSLDSGRQRLYVDCVPSSRRPACSRRCRYGTRVAKWGRSRPQTARSQPPFRTRFTGTLPTFGAWCDPCNRNDPTFGFAEAVATDTSRVFIGDTLRMTIYYSITTMVSSGTPGGPGSYTVNNSQTVGSETMQAASTGKADWSRSSSRPRREQFLSSRQESSASGRRATQGDWSLGLALQTPPSGVNYDPATAYVAGNIALVGPYAPALFYTQITTPVITWIPNPSLGVLTIAAPSRRATPPPCRSPSPRTPLTAWWSRSPGAHRTRASTYFWPTRPQPTIRLRTFRPRFGRWAPSTPPATTSWT